jgi:hypothetical protein
MRLATDYALLLFAGAIPHYLTEIVAGAVIAYISFWLRLVPISTNVKMSCVEFLEQAVKLYPEAKGDCFK